MKQLLYRLLQVGWWLGIAGIIGPVRAQFGPNNLFYTHKRLKIAALHIISNDHKLVVANKRGYPIYLLNRHNVVTDTLHTVPPEQVVFYNDSTLIFQGHAYSEEVRLKGDRLKVVSKSRGTLPGEILLLAPLKLGNWLFGFRPSGSDSGKGDKRYYAVDLAGEGARLIIDRPVPRISSELVGLGLSFKYAYRDSSFVLFDKPAATLYEVSLSDIKTKSFALPVTSGCYWHYYFDHIVEADYFLKACRQEGSGSYYLYKREGNTLVPTGQLPKPPVEVVDGLLHYAVRKKKNTEHYLIDINTIESPSAILLPEVLIEQEQPRH